MLRLRQLSVSPGWSTPAAKASDCVQVKHRVQVGIKATVVHTADREQVSLSNSTSLSRRALPTVVLCHHHGYQPVAVCWYPVAMVCHLIAN